MSKRRHTEAATAGAGAAAGGDEDEPSLAIRVSASEQLSAPKFVLQCFCSVARALPSGAEVWDVSGLRVLEQPVSAEVVQAWLDVCQQHGVTGPPEQEADAAPPTAAGLARLLAFADAVGSTPAVLRACLAGLERLVLEVRVGERSAHLAMDGRAHFWDEEGDNQRLLWRTAARGSDLDHPLGVVTPAEAASVGQQAAAQVEALLHLAYRLQLAPLADRLHAFVRGCCVFDVCLIPPALLESAVFSERVMDAAALCKGKGKRAWLDSVLLEAGTVSVVGLSSLLRPVDLTEQQKQPVIFHAALQRDFSCRRWCRRMPLALGA